MATQPVFVPSPKSNQYSATEPSGSLLPPPLKVTSWPVSAVVGLAARAAMGALLTGVDETMIVTVSALSLSKPSVSCTRSLAVKVPAELYM